MGLILSVIRLMTQVTVQSIFVRPYLRAEIVDHDFFQQYGDCDSDAFDPMPSMDWYLRPGMPAK